MQTPKTARSERRFKLPVLLVNLLREYLAKRKTRSDSLFPYRAGTVSDDHNLIRREIAPVCERLGIPRFGWHSLRHTFSTCGGNSGVPLPVLQYLLGHASVETTMIYTHPLLEAERRAVERIAALLLPSAPRRAEEEARPKVLIR